MQGSALDPHNYQIAQSAQCNFAESPVTYDQILAPPPGFQAKPEDGADFWAEFLLKQVILRRFLLDYVPDVSLCFFLFLFVLP